LLQQHSWFLLLSTANEPHFGHCIATLDVYCPSQFSVNYFTIKYCDKQGFVGARFLSIACFYCLLRLKILSRKAKKAEGLEQHKKIMREKDQKRKERKQVSLPAKHASKGKK
jgi:hypothetical protein